MAPAPTYVELITAIVAEHGSGDRHFVESISDVNHGLAFGSHPQFWDALRRRRPDGTVDEVVRAWSKDEIRSLQRKVQADLADANRRANGGAPARRLTQVQSLLALMVALLLVIWFFGFELLPRMAHIN